MVGTDVATGVQRMTFGFFELCDGIGFVPMAMGLFAVAEIIKNLEEPEERIVLEGKIGRLWPSRKEFGKAFPAAIRGTFIGSFLGLLPGGGPTLGVVRGLYRREAAVEGAASVRHRRRRRRRRPEAANNASAQTAFIPLLTLGIPSNPTIAHDGGRDAHPWHPAWPRGDDREPEVFWG